MTLYICNCLHLSLCDNCLAELREEDNADRPNEYIETCIGRSAPLAKVSGSCPPPPLSHLHILFPDIILCTGTSELGFSFVSYLTVSNCNYIVFSSYIVMSLHL